VSSERDTRPWFHQFQKLMQRMEPKSVEWWAEAIPACRQALAESRAARLDFETDGQPRSAEEIGRMEQREVELERLAKEFTRLRNRKRLPHAKP
jgi:hypothetical protein